MGEMMNEARYIKWVEKAENGGLDVEEGKLEFKRLCNRPEAITDMKGPQKYKQRVWVHTNAFGSSSRTCRRASSRPSQSLVRSSSIALSLLGIASGCPWASSLPNG